MNLAGVPYSISIYSSRVSISLAVILQQIHMSQELIVK